MKRYGFATAVTGLACALLMACAAQEGEAMAQNTSPASDTCTISYRLAKLDLEARDRGGRLPSPLTRAQVGQTPKALKGDDIDYIRAVTQEAETLATSTFCDLIDSDTLLIDLTFISANGLSKEEADVLRLPLHGQARFDASSGVLQAVFVRSATQTVYDLYALQSGDDIEPDGPAHADTLLSQINMAISDESGDVPPPISWVVEELSDSPNRTPRPEVRAKVKAIMATADAAYVSAAKTIMERAVPNTTVEGGYGFTGLVSADVAATYKTD